ncbi:hypothetical protein [Streptomyces sp. L-9-10]|uniref:AbiJ-related protein n=1 Tax=Streptomyces sp. L-9-10 TaxID=1478131 RepID=UPI001F01A89A|nr:hypothetical protein [Streptomyces sp. L-9-10]
MNSTDPARAKEPPTITAVTRRDIFKYLRGISRPWWGELDEVTFLEGLYDLDRTSSRRQSASDCPCRYPAAPVQQR